MQYAFTIIAVDQNDYTPELVVEQHGSIGGPTPHIPTITHDRVEVFAEWLKTKAPNCFKADLSAIRMAVDCELDATLHAMRKIDVKRSKPQVLFEFKKTGLVLWLTLEVSR